MHKDNVPVSAIFVCILMTLQRDCHVYFVYDEHVTVNAVCVLLFKDDVTVMRAISVYAVMTLLGLSDVICVYGNRDDVTVRYFRV